MCVSDLVGDGVGCGAGTAHATGGVVVCADVLCMLCLCGVHVICVLCILCLCGVCVFVVLCVVCIGWV